MQPTTSFKSKVAGVAMMFAAAAGVAAFPVAAASSAFADSARVRQLQGQIRAEKVKQAAEDRRGAAADARGAAADARAAASNDGLKCAQEMAVICPKRVSEVTLATACKVRYNPSVCTSG